MSDKIATMELSHRMAKRLRVIAGSGEDLYGDDEDDENEEEEVT